MAPAGVRLGLVLHRARHGEAGEGVGARGFDLPASGPELGWDDGEAGRTVDRFLARVIVAGEGPRGPPQGPLDGGQPFPPDTSAQGGQPHEVTFEVSSAEPFARHFCFAAEARR